VRGNDPKITTEIASAGAKFEAWAKDTSPGSYEYVRTSWHARGAHVWAWRNTANGIVWEDAQTGMIVDMADYIDKSSGFVQWFCADDAKFVGKPEEWVKWEK